MQKPSVKKLLLTVGILTLTLAAFITGGIVMSSVQAASTNALHRSSAQSGCDKKGPGCKSNQTKGIVTITSVAGNRIQATYLEPLNERGNTVTIITTSSTAYQPDPSVVAAGKTIFVSGTVNNDGSITALGVGSSHPTIAYYGGVVTRIDASSITVQTKDLTRTIHLLASTTFLKGQPKLGPTQPALLSDVKVGDAVEAHGKLNSDGSLTADTVFIVQPGDAAK